MHSEPITQRRAMPNVKAIDLIKLERRKKFMENYYDAQDILTQAHPVWSGFIGFYEWVFLTVFVKEAREHGLLKEVDLDELQSKIDNWQASAETVEDAVHS